MKISPLLHSLRCRTSAALALTALLVGCATPPPVAKKDPVFYPPPPEQVRVQFLCHLHGEGDFASQRSAFLEFLVGKPKNHFNTMLKPYGVAVYDHKIYVADTATGRMTYLDMASRRMGQFGTSGRGVLRKPVNVRVGPDHLLYVTDSGRDQIVVFQPDGTFVKAYGDGKQFQCTDCIPTETELYICDIKEHAIKVYDKATMELKRTIGKRGNEPGEFNFPNNIVMDKDGNLYVTDVINFRVQKLDREGKPLLSMGKAGDNAGAFKRPKGTAVDRNGIVYVVDALSNIVQLFNKEGKALMFIGGKGIAPGRLILPAQVCIDYDNIEDFRSYMDPQFDPEYLIFVTNQIELNKVSVFAFGRLRDQAVEPAPAPAAKPAAPATPAPAPVPSVDPAATPVK